jgi:hypothetical protein
MIDKNRLVQELIRHKMKYNLIDSLKRMQFVLPPTTFNSRLNSMRKLQ